MSFEKKVLDLKRNLWNIIYRTKDDIEWFSSDHVVGFIRLSSRSEKSDTLKKRVSFYLAKR